MTATQLRFALALFAAVAACSTEVPVGSRDGGPVVDAAPVVDAPSADLGPPLDAGAVGDAGGQACNDDASCGAGRACARMPGMCAAPGVCQAFDPTTLCDITPAFVCGCDGHTYGTSCYAQRVGVSVDHDGSCPPFTDGCISDLDCMDGWFCEFNLGSCGGTGTCTDRGITETCATICAPVCGCDGMSYVNDCLRRKAAQSVSQNGTCPGDAPPCTMGGACCTTTADCTSGQECAGTGGPLECMPIPSSPDCWIDDDCGTGHTCMDPFLCGCGASCPRPDTPGTCT